MSTLQSSSCLVLGSGAATAPTLQPHSFPISLCVAHVHYAICVFKTLSRGKLKRFCRIAIAHPQFPLSPSVTYLPALPWALVAPVVLAWAHTGRPRLGSRPAVLEGPCLPCRPSSGYKRKAGGEFQCGQKEEIPSQTSRGNVFQVGK